MPPDPLTCCRLRVSGASVKDVFEFGMNGTVAHLDPSTWNIGMTKKPETYSLKAREPVYLRKWHITAMTTRVVGIITDEMHASLHLS